MKIWDEGRRSGAAGTPPRQGRAPPPPARPKPNAARRVALVEPQKLSFFFFFFNKMILLGVIVIVVKMMITLDHYYHFLLWTFEKRDFLRVWVVVVFFFGGVLFVFPAKPRSLRSWCSEVSSVGQCCPFSLQLKWSIPPEEPTLGSSWNWIAAAKTFLFFLLVCVCFFLWGNDVSWFPFFFCAFYLFFCF